MERLFKPTDEDVQALVARTLREETAAKDGTRGCCYVCGAACSAGRTHVHMGFPKRVCREHYTSIPKEFRRYGRSGQGTHKYRKSPRT